MAIIYTSHIKLIIPCKKAVIFYTESKQLSEQLVQKFCALPSKVFHTLNLELIRLGRQQSNWKIILQARTKLLQSLLDFTFDLPRRDIVLQGYFIVSEILETAGEENTSGEIRHL